MSPTCNRSTALQRFECGNTVEMRNGIMIDSTRDCTMLGWPAHQKVSIQGRDARKEKVNNGVGICFEKEGSTEVVGGGGIW